MSVDVCTNIFNLWSYYSYTTSYIAMYVCVYVLMYVHMYVWNRSAKNLSTQTLKHIFKARFSLQTHRIQCKIVKEVFFMQNTKFFVYNRESTQKTICFILLLDVKTNPLVTNKDELQSHAGRKHKGPRFCVLLSLYQPFPR